MNWKWRAIAGTLLLAGTIVWLPMAVTTNAATPLGSASSVVRGPLADDNADNSGDNGNSDNDSSDNGNTNDNSSGNANTNNNDNTSGNGNNNNNDNTTGATNEPAPPPPPPPNSSTQPNPNDVTGAHQQNGNLGVDLGRTAEKPVVNTPFQVTVTGTGAPIESVSWWADGGGAEAGPNNDDLAHVGTMTAACNGTNPCSASWPVVARNVGFYTLHAKVRDTSGNEVQTDWQFLSSSNARS